MSTSPLDKIVLIDMIAFLLLVLVGFSTTAAAATTPPSPPMPYAVPAGAIRVENGTALATELRRTTPRTIVLADGVYTNSTYFRSPCGHALYAQHLGKAVLTAGLAIGSTGCPGGSVVRGIAFSVTDPAKTLHDSILHVWGSATGTQVLDVTLNGGRRIDAGVYVRQPEGLVLRRIVARNLLGYGVIVDANKVDLTLMKPAVIEDIDVSNVSYAVPMASHGTAEACIWIGNMATARRLRVRDCAWTGVWTGTATKDSWFSDLDIDRSTHGVGLYIEHFTRNTTFQRMTIGPRVRTGVNCEWADASAGWPACDGVIIQDSTITSSCAGIYLDRGTRYTTVRRTTFRNQSWAAIGNYEGKGNLWDVSGNDTAGIGSNALPVSTEHNKCGR